MTSRPSWHRLKHSALVDIAASASALASCLAGNDIPELHQLVSDLKVLGDLNRQEAADGVSKLSNQYRN